MGNAAGEGAKIALLNKKERHEAEKAVQKIEFLELAACPEFQDCFVDELGFGKSNKMNFKELKELCQSHGFTQYSAAGL